MLLIFNVLINLFSKISLLNNQLIFENILITFYKIMLNQFTCQQQTWSW